MIASGTALPVTARTRIRHHRPEPGAVLAVGAGIAGLALLVALAGLALDQRDITGAPAWLKPAKFGSSVAIYLLTLRWLISYLTGRRRLLLVASAVSVVTLTAELGLLDLQVIRGTSSHFNETTALNTAIFYAMGLLISLVFLVTVIIGVLVLRARGLDAGLAAGIRWGLGVCLLGMTEAGFMIANRQWNQGGGHTVGAPDGGPGLPVTGWSTAYGDLRVGHFAGLHALQLLPAVAWLLATRTNLDERVRARLVTVTGVAYAAMVALLTWQALRGQPLLRPDGRTLLALAALLVAAAAGVRLALQRTVRTG